ncbi:MAG: ABC transporter permease [Bdellovibrionota bacterium]
MKFILRRLLLAVPVVWGVATIVFFFVHLLPGDPAEIVLGENASRASLEKLRADHHLDEPLSVQYGLFLSDLFKGNLRESIVQRKAVTALIGERWLYTAELALLALLIALAISLPLGTIAAVRAGRLIDQAAMAFSLLGICLPAFCLAPLLIIAFSVKLGWLPVSGAEAPGSIFLPALTLGVSLSAILARMVRAQMLEILSRDYLRTARAKGLAPWQVVIRHALRNALLPVVTLVGIQMGVLLSGAIITEKIFAWPGLGSLLLQGIFQRDYPVVQGCVLVISLTYVLVNLGTDLLYGILDPRIRVEGEKK